MTISYREQLDLILKLSGGAVTLWSPYNWKIQTWDIFYIFILCLILLLNKCISSRSLYGSGKMLENSFNLSTIVFDPYICG